MTKARQDVCSVHWAARLPAVAAAPARGGPDPPWDIALMDDPTAAALSPRPPDCNAALVLADGAVFWGRGIGARGTSGRRSLLQHCDNRLSGNFDRSVLCRADHHLYLSAYRKCRRQSRGHRGDDTGRPRSRRANRANRAGQFPRRPIARSLARSARRRRALRRRHEAAHAADPRPGRAQRGHHLPAWRQIDVAALRAEAIAWPGLEGMDLAREVSCRQSYEWRRDGVAARERLWQTGRSALSCRRRRLRREAQYPAHARRAWLPRHRRAGDRIDRGHIAARARRRLFVERAGRSGGDRRSMRCRCCAN